MGSPAEAPGGPPRSQGMPGGSQDPTVLPHLQGTSLAGRSVRFPEDLPPGDLVLVIGFTHAARQDVAAWKAALAARNLAFLSLPTAALDTAPETMTGVAAAMRAHVPAGVWDSVVQIHRGGSDLRRTFGWLADECAKVVRVARDGTVCARHDHGPFSASWLARVVGSATDLAPEEGA